MTLRPWHRWAVVAYQPDGRTAVLSGHVTGYRAQDRLTRHRTGDHPAVPPLGIEPTDHGPHYRKQRTLIRALDSHGPLSAEALTEFTAMSPLEVGRQLLELSRRGWAVVVTRLHADPAEGIAVWRLRSDREWVAEIRHRRTTRTTRTTPSQPERGTT